MKDIDWEGIAIAIALGWSVFSIASCTKDVTIAKIQEESQHKSIK